MRIVLSLGALALVAAVVAALTTGGGDGRRNGREVAASFYPLAYAAQRAGGPGLVVRNLTPPGAEPHDLEVSADDVRTLHAAHLVLLLGHGFQPQLERAAGHGPRVLRLLDTPGLRRRGHNDPHVWLDPVRYALVARRVASALNRPAAAAGLQTRLAELDGAYRRGLARCARREIVTSHEAFGYLAQRYGLRQVAITGLSPEAEPTPRQLSRVVGAIRLTGATTVFTETLVSPRLARTVARETGARTAVLNPVEGLTGREQRRGEDYFSLMRRNLAVLRRGLGCR
ncbi:MAG: zinc transport system substrate-binding protein [Solirubrobacteraceae bacterium]|jgi:zinc transport system substrate-binding protein|nr:zinc transport system substrate-binding protein [Solirubrobacteraceae bacterium]